MNRNLLPSLLWIVLSSLAAGPAAGQSSLRSDAAGNLREVSALVPADGVQVLPQRQVLKPGETARFSAVWAARPGDTVSWAKNGTPIPGQAGDSLVLPTIAAADEGEYTATVVTPSGTFTSGVARLYLDGDGDGLPDSWETASFGNLTRQGHEDWDFDGVTNAEEFEDGTNPTASAFRFSRLTVEAVNGDVVVSPPSSTGRYPAGSVVTLVASPRDGWEFVRWTGATASYLPSLTITMNAHRSLTAEFREPVPLATAAGAGALAWITGGQNPWSGVSQDAVPEGSGVVTSGRIVHGQQSWVEATVTGPGSISWWWKVSSDAGNTSRPGDGLRCEIDGQMVQRIAGEIPWQPLMTTLGPGSHTVRWIYEKDATVDAGSDAAWVDRVIVSNVTPSPVAAALDLPGTVTLLAGGSEIWLPQTEVSHDGVDALKSPPILDDQQAWIEATVVGPGVVSFWWKVSSENVTNDGTNASDGMNFFIDGTLSETIVGEQGWVRVEKYLNGAEHKLRWRYVKDFTAVAGADAGWLDEVTFTPSPPLDAALDQTGLTFSSGGSSPWITNPFPSNAHDGVDAGQSGPISSGQESWVETTVSGPGTLSFWWNVSSYYLNYFEFLVDGQSYRTISGTPGWAQTVVAIPSGSHTLRWRYFKTTSTATGLDSGLLDEVVWTAGPPPLGEAVDAPSITFQATGTASWSSQAVTTHDGSDALQAGPLAASGLVSRLESVVSGPGVLAFWWKCSCAATTSTTQGLFLRSDGIDLRRVSGERDWELVRQIIPPGVHRVTWEFVRPSASSGSNSVWLDEISFVSSGAVPLETALDGAGLVWKSGGHGTWTGFTSPLAADGVDLAASPALADYGFSWLETEVTGPGQLNFQWSSSTESSDSYLYFVDGDEAFSRANVEAWTPFSTSLPAGTHKIRWRHEKDSSGVEGIDTVFLDAVAFTPMAATPLMDAVDLTSLPLHTNSLAWTRQTDVIRDGSDAAKSGVTPDNSASLIRTHLTGPGTLTFWWKVSCASGDSLQFLQDGSTAKPSISGTAGDWVQVVQAVPAGRHAYEWRYSKNASGVAGSDAGWVDEIIFTPTTNPVLAGGVDIPGGTPFLTGGTASSGTWQIQSAITHDGVDALQSPTVGNSQNAWFETVAEGPGVLSFWYKVSSQANGDYLEFWLDNSVRHLLTSGEIGWTKFEMLLPPGSHRVLWDYEKNFSLVAGQDAAWIDQIAVAPLIPLAQAADTNLVIVTGGDAEWDGQPLAGAAPDASDRAASGLVTSGEESWMETTVNGPGTVAFQWRVSSYENYGFLKLMVDGETVRSISGNLGWESVARTLGSGSHKIRWSFERTESYSSGDNRGYVDQISFTPAAAPPLADAIDQASSTAVASKGPATWFRQAGTTHDGSDSARSGVIGPDQSTHLTMDVTGPGTLSFWWKLSAAYNGGYLRCFMNGVEQTDFITGWVDWEQRSFIVPAGDQVVTWYYAKNSSAAGGLDAGWLDEVVFSPSISLPQALDTTGITWTTGGNAPWAGFIDGGSDWASSGAIGHNQESWVETMITGPGTLSFDWKASSYSLDYLTFTVDGLRMSRQSGPTAPWQTHHQSLPPGLHTVRWTYAKDAATVDGFDRGQLDAVNFTPQALPPLSDGADAPELSFGSPEPHEWSRDTATSHDGIDSLRTTAVAANTDSSLASAVAGPGTLSFWWKVSSHSSDALRFYVNGIERIAGISGERNWQKISVYLDDGDHTLVWKYLMDSYYAGGENAGWIDEVTFSPAGGEIPLAVALDQPSLVWSTGPATVPWVGLSTASAWDGTDVAAILKPYADGPSWLETTVTGPTTVTFRWRSDTGRRAIYYFDGVVQGNGFYGNSDWTLVTQLVPAGTHTLRWEGGLYGNPSPGSAGVWLDAVTVEGSQYQAWAASFSLAGPDADPMADLDKDGLANVTEYAFNLDPTEGAFPGGQGISGRLPVTRIEGIGADARLVIEYLRRQNGGLTYTPRFSDDLGVWSTNAGIPQITDLGSGWELVKVPDAATLAGKSKRFASVIVTMP